MAPFDGIGCSDSSLSSKCLSQFYPGKHDEHDNHRDRNYRDDCNRTLWRRLQQLVGYEHHSKWSGGSVGNDLLCTHGRGRFSARNCRTISRRHRDRRHHSNNRANVGHNFAVGLLAVTLLIPAGVKADDDNVLDGGVSATAAPQAVSSGQAVNQAVQINQGGYSKQGYSPGHFCNSPTFTVTPFFLGNESFPEYVRGQNYGIQATISVPLDREMVRLCKDLAAKKIEKERLDFALVRALKCAQLIESGFMFHPSSPFSIVCSDVVPIAREPKTSEASSQTSSEPES